MCCLASHGQLAEQGYVARAGQMTFATFVEAPKQRNSRDENALVKGGQACEKGTRGKPLAEERKRPNRTKSKAMARGGHWVHTIGLQRAKVKVGLMNLAYNMACLIQLTKRDANAVKRNLGAITGKVRQ